MTPSFKQTAECEHDWLMNLAIDLAALCDMWRWKWHQLKSFGCFKLKCSHCPPLCGFSLALGIGYASKNCLIWWEIQLCTVDTVNIIDLWRNTCRHALIIFKIYWIEYFKIVFLNNYNCTYKTHFANLVTLWMTY